MKEGIYMIIWPKDCPYVLKPWYIALVQNEKQNSGCAFLLEPINLAPYTKIKGYRLLVSQRRPKARNIFVYDKPLEDITSKDIRDSIRGDENPANFKNVKLRKIGELEKLASEFDAALKILKI